MRHAKSSWDDARLADHDRPLNKRGKQDAPRMGHFLRQQGLVPDLIISSTAKRAWRTAVAVAEELGYDPAQIALEPTLYEAEPTAYLARLDQAADSYQTIMLVGHNPGLSDLLSELTGRYENMTTANIAYLRLPIQHWAEASDGLHGQLVQLWRPKEVISNW